MRIGLHYGCHCKFKGMEHLTLFELTIILSLLLIRSGDIEPNPGPNTPNIDSESIDESLILNYCSIVHYNIQSISSKVDLIGSELRNFNIICLTETWLGQHIPDDSIKTNEFKLCRRDRQTDNYGGGYVYLKDSRRRTDLDLPNIECIWVEIDFHHKIFFSLEIFKKPPNSSAQTLSSIEVSISLAMDSRLKDIFITGDFNLDTQKAATNQNLLTCQYFNLDQLIVEPTHFTENSSSILDLAFTTNKCNILSSGVGDPFLEHNIRFHDPVYFVLNFRKIVTPVLRRHIWLYDRGDCQALSQNIIETNWDSLKNNDINIYATNITDKISELELEIAILAQETGGKH